MILWILGLSAAFAVALNGTMVMPIIVLAVDRIPGFDEATATLISSAEIAGIALYSLLLPRLAGTNRRLVAIGGFAAVIIGEASSFWLTGAPTLTVARLVTGLGEGAIFSLIATRLASMANAERIWGQINLIGGTTMGLLLLALSSLPTRPGNEPIFLGLALFAIAMAPIAYLMRDHARIPSPATTSTALDRGKMALALIVVFLVYAVQAGQWAISGYIGKLSNLSATELGTYLAVSSVVGFVGAVVPSMARDRDKRLASVLFGFLLMAVSLYCFFNIYEKYVFLFAQIFLNIGFYVVTPFLTGLLTEHDPDGSLLSRILVIALVGAATGTAVAGPILTSFGPAAFGWAFMLPLAIAVICGIIVFGHLHLRLSAEEPEGAVD